MPYVAINPRKFENTSVGSGQCVAFVQAATQVGPTRFWKRGALVRGANLAVGTVIATFDEEGHYANDTSGKSHAAIYLGQTAAGIIVLDQWMETRRAPGGVVARTAHPVSERTISFLAKTRAVNDGRNYYVVE
ncbi:BPSL0067 family protein [Massilia solisilvae]|uniref:BPSL0067 family protein n=1 Tax=Massilia solisilvae TaxID=1811225 RepID=A0ABT2BQY6_9BURK|nr:BPSL0067 family protein [Massilia solisilvae]MCS0610909.1 BPSL0067 family protein [Massilia solisilvae]